MKWIQTQTIIIPNSLVEFSSTLTGAPLDVSALSMYGLAHSPAAAHQQVRQDSRLPSQQRWPCLPRRKVGAAFFGHDVCHSCHLSYHQIKPFPFTRSCAVLQPSFLYPLRTWWQGLWRTMSRVEWGTSRAILTSLLMIETLFPLRFLSRDKIPFFFSNYHSDFALFKVWVNQ